MRLHNENRFEIESRQYLAGHILGYALGGVACYGRSQSPFQVSMPAWIQTMESTPSGLSAKNQLTKVGEIFLDLLLGRRGTLDVLLEAV